MSLLPVTSITVMMPNGKSLTMTGDADTKQVRIEGLVYGPAILDAQEIWAVRQMLNEVFHAS